MGLTPFLNFTALGETFRWFRQRYRNVELQLIKGLMLRVLPRLRDGTLDIAAVAADACALDGDPFSASDIELLLLTRPDVPLTPAAEHFAHCLASVCAALPPAR